MTSPQSDPAQDIPAALARLAEQTIGLQRQLTRMEAVFTEQNHITTQMIREAEARIGALTDAKFVTYRTLIDSQAEKVALALEATEKAIGKAEVATERRIDKESSANNDRFSAVNEFRSQLADQAATFMPRREALQIIDAATTRIRELAELTPLLATKSEMQVMTDRYSERIGELNDRVNRQEGVLHGAQSNKANLYAAMGAATALIIAVIVVLNFVTSKG